MFIWGLREKKLYLIWHFVVSYLRTKRNKSRYGKTGQNFLTWPDPKNTLPELDFFFYPKQKRVDPWPDMCFCRSTWPDLTRPATRPKPESFFVLNFFFGKKKVKLRQYWFNFLFWALRKQLIYLHNCMQINWKINGWAFCNE